MLNKCINCQFYVSSNEKICPNCGLSAPGKELQKKFKDFERNLTITLSFALAIVFSFIVLFLRSDGKFDNLSELPLILIGSLLFSLAFSILISMSVMKRLEKNEFKMRFAYSKVDPTLTGIEDTITMRNYELDEKYRETENLLKRAKESGSQEIVQKLLAAREIILSQTSRYELQSQKIHLIRLQNGLRPMLYRQNFSDTENKFFSEKIDQTIAEIETMRQSLTNDYAIEFPEEVESEKQSFLAQLDETKTGCERLRKAILSRQAARALQNVSPIQENFGPPDESKTIHATDTFNIQTTLTSFSESFDELEREYKRIEAEREIERKFIKI